MSADKYTLKVWHYPTLRCRTHEHLTREKVSDFYHFIMDTRTHGVIINIYNTNIDSCVYYYDDFPITHHHEDTFVRATEPRTINGVTYYPVDREEEE